MSNEINLALAEALGLETKVVVSAGYVAHIKAKYPVSNEWFVFCYDSPEVSQAALKLYIKKLKLKGGSWHTGNGVSDESLEKAIALSSIISANLRNFDGSAECVGE